MGKNDKEKMMLSEWGIKNFSNDIFSQIDTEKKSYFVRRTDELYIREYAFETLPEVMKEINALWENDEMMEEIKRIIGVAAMKNKPVRTVEKKQQEDGQVDKEERLPAFIYNF